jgi:hypothetical protein
MLQLDLQNDFYTTVLKTKHKLYIVTGLVPSPEPSPPPQLNNFVACLIPSTSNSVVYMTIKGVKYLDHCVLLGGRRGFLITTLCV